MKCDGQAQESAEAQEAAPPVEEAQIEEEEEEESDDMAWDEMDLDAVRLPGQAAPEVHICSNYLCGADCLIDLIREIKYSAAGPQFWKSITLTETGLHIVCQLHTIVSGAQLLGACCRRRQLRPSQRPMEWRATSLSRSRRPWHRQPGRKAQKRRAAAAKRTRMSQEKMTVMKRAAVRLILTPISVLPQDFIKDPFLIICFGPHSLTLSR